MTLRVRLTLYFTIIVVLPLTVAGLAARFALVRSIESRVEESVDLGLRGIAAELGVIRSRAGDVAEDLASPGRGLGTAMDARDRRALREAIGSVLGERRRASVVVVADPSGRVLAARAEIPRFLRGVDRPAVDELAGRAVNGDLPPLVVGEVRAVEATSGRVLGWVLAARWFDEALAEDLAGAFDLELTLVAAGRPVATTGASLQLSPEGSGLPASEQVSQGSVVRSLEFDGAALVASRSREPIIDARRTVNLVLVAILLLAVVTAAVLGWLVAQMVVRPVVALAEAAGDVAAGDLDRRIDVGGRGEIAVLGEAFNTMTAHLRQQVRELERSRDALQRSLDRLGQTLSSTLDLNRTLAAVVDAAASALTAERAALFMLAPGRANLYLKVGRGLPQEVAERQVPVGHGVVGWVAQTASVVRLPQDSDAAPDVSDAEPDARALLAVPLFTPNAGQVIGVLVLYDRSDGEPFDDEDLHTLRSFAVQASVAIDNVRLHEATQQASITDGLTGLWNLRYFQQRADEEVERASRFGHDLAMVVLDIDHFKAVNDRYGHRIGDQVLVEVSRRVAAEVREVDTLARYGGEELILVLPETDAAGARRTAERIRQAVAGRPIATDVGAVEVTVSLGVAASVGGALTASDLLHEADRAMYGAKAAGRDRVVTADEVGRTHGASTT